MFFGREELDECWFEEMSNGGKTVEARLNKPQRFGKLRGGDTIEFYGKVSGKSLVVNVLSVCVYDTFETLLQKEGLGKVLPNIPSIKEGIDVYRKFYSEEEEKQYGVIAVRVQKHSNDLKNQRRMEYILDKIESLVIERVTADLNDDREYDLESYDESLRNLKKKYKELGGTKEEISTAMKSCIYRFSDRVC